MLWVNVRSLIDIAIVSFLIYRILILLVGTRAIQLIKGVVFLTIFAGIASFFRFRLLSWFLGNSLLALSFAVPIVFQPELRKMLEELGRGLLSTHHHMSDDEADMKIRQITAALSYLKAHKIGALLVFQQEEELGEYTRTAIQLNANITEELLISIFWINNPLHDGAVVLNRYSLIAGGCYLPLADAPEISRWYGTRHRAALGVSQVSDAIVFVVSEERGEISLAVKGKLSKNLKDFQIEGVLRHYFKGGQVVTGWKRIVTSLKNMFWPDITEKQNGGLVK